MSCPNGMVIPAGGSNVERQSLSADFKRTQDLPSCEGMLEILPLLVLNASKWRDFATKTWNYLLPLKPPGNASLAAVALSLPALRWVTFTYLAKLEVRNFWIFLIRAVRALESSHRGLPYPKARRNTYQRMAAFPSVCPLLGSIGSSVPYRYRQKCYRSNVSYQQ